MVTVRAAIHGYQSSGIPMSKNIAVIYSLHEFLY